MANFRTAELKRQHEVALDRFKLAVDVWGPQRQRENNALKFQSGDQWPDDIKAARAGSPGGQGQPIVPPRPMLTMRALDQPIAQIVNQARSAELTGKVLADGNGDKDTADVFMGKIRKAEADSHAQSAYLWAFERMVPAGFGVFRVNKRWKYESGATGPEKWDQQVTFERVLNQASVYLDPLAQKRLFEDGQWAFETADVRIGQYKRDHKETKLAQLAADDATFTAEGDDLKHWVVGAGDEQCYRIALYWFIEYEETEERDPDDATRVKKNRTPKVMHGRLNGIEWIDEPEEWDGPDIPLVPMIAKEYNIGGTRIFEGLVAPAESACRMINYGASGLAEQIGLTTRPKWKGYAGQFEGFEDQWDQANSRNITRLEAHATTEATGNQLLPLPELEAPEPPIQAMTQMIGVFTNFVRSTTGVPDAALGHVNPNDRSGKALQELKQASEQGTGNNLAALAASVKRGYEIAIRLIAKLYDRPGREMQLLAADGKQSSVILGQPRPQGPGMPPKPPIDLMKGQYSVTVDVGKNFATRRQEAQSGMSELAHSAPELVPRFADLWVKSMDIPEGEAIADRLKPPGTDDENIPPQVKQMVGQLQQQLQQAAQIIQQEQVKAQKEIELARMNNESREKIAGMQLQGSLIATEAKINSSDAQAMVKAELERFKIEIHEQIAHIVHAKDQAHERGMHHADAAHEAGLQADQQRHELELAQRQHEQALEQGDQGHQQALEQQAMQPEPAEA